MARSTKVSGIASAVMLVGSLSVGAPAVTATEGVGPGGGPAVVAGVLQNDRGQPAPGYVMLMAQPATLGASYSDIPVSGLVRTAPDGSYAFGQRLLDASPAASKLRRIAAANNGWVNFVVAGSTPGSSGQYYVPRRLTPSGWSAQGERSTVDVRADHELTTAERNAYARSAAHPDDPPPGCFWQRTGPDEPHWTRVGELHRWRYTSSRFYYGRVADSSIEVKAGGEGKGWSAAGYVHITNSKSQGLSGPHGPGVRGVRMLSKFNYGRYKRVWNGAGTNLCHGEKVQALGWIGGLMRGAHMSNTRDGRCQHLPSTERTSILPHGSIWFSKAHGTDYGLAVTVLDGIELGAHSGLSQYVKFHYTSTQREYYCPAYGHKAPSDAGSIAIGPRH